MRNTRCTCQHKNISKTMLTIKQYLLFVVLIIIHNICVVSSSGSAETEFGLPIAELFITSNSSSGQLRLVTNVSDSEVIISEDMILNGQDYNQIVLFCNASYPVEWSYEGDGAPRLHTGQFRSFKVFDNPSTYEFSAVIALYQERYNEQQTGTYVCRSIDDHRLQVFYHLYFPGDFGFPAIRNRVVTTAKKDNFATLPCRATHPYSQMSLLKIAPVEEMANLTDSKSVTYDPREGFQLNLSEFKHPYGTYICEARGMRSFWKMDLVPPKDEEVLYSPRQTRVSLNAFQNQTFTCRAQEPITIVLPTSYEIGTVELTTNLTYKYPYKATLQLRSATPLTTIANYFRINCVTLASFRTLHSWHYSNIETERISVTFDKAQRRMLCCNNLDLSPTYDSAPCETLTDCEITRTCFEGSHCRPAIFPAPKLVDAPKGCIAAQFPDKINTHVMRCSLGERNEVHYITESLEPDQIIIYNGETPSTGKILKIRALQTSQRDHPNEVRVKCTGKAFYFSLNFVFALEKEDGSLEYVDADSVENVQTYTPSLKKIVDKNVKRIYCFAPLTRSSQWVNVSIPITSLEFPSLVSTTDDPTAEDSSTKPKRRYQRKQWKPRYN